MARAMAPEREQEYQELLAFVVYYATHVKGLNLTDRVHPANVIEEMVQKHGKSKMLIGLRMGVNDSIEDLRDQSVEYIARLDEMLRTAGIMTFSEIRRRYAASYKRLLKRGRIKDETEYYLVKGIVDDLTTPISQQERDQLENMMVAFEQALLPGTA